MDKRMEIIGIDHGWSSCKTVSSRFVTGIKEITTEPGNYDDVLEFEGKYYKIGEVRLEVRDTKTENNNFYLLTLAAIAKELKRRGRNESEVFIAVGLPLTKFGREREDFLKYLKCRKDVEFEFEQEHYHITITNAAVFPQCYAAIADRLHIYDKRVVIVDIGSWTIDILPVNEGRPDASRCVTDQNGIIRCMRSINEQCVRQIGEGIDEAEIEYIMEHGAGRIDDSYMKIIRNELDGYTDRIYNSLREYGYNLRTTQFVFVGGGADVIRKYGRMSQKNFKFILDVKANAKGFEYLAKRGLAAKKML